MKFRDQISQVEHRRPVVTYWFLRVGLLSVLFSNGYQDHTHHKNHQPNGQQGRSQHVGDFPAVAGKIQAADDDAACQETAPGGHEVNGEPVDFTFTARRLICPE